MTTDHQEITASCSGLNRNTAGRTRMAGLARGSGHDRIKPLVGTPVPAVTRTGPSPGTWLTAVPRTWRTGLGLAGLEPYPEKVIVVLATVPGQACIVCSCSDIRSSNMLQIHQRALWRVVGEIERVIIRSETTQPT